MQKGLLQTLYGRQQPAMNGKPFYVI